MYLHLRVLIETILYILQLYIIFLVMYVHRTVFSTITLHYFLRNHDISSTWKEAKGLNICTHIRSTYTSLKYLYLSMYLFKSVTCKNWVLLKLDSYTILVLSFKNTALFIRDLLSNNKHTALFLEWHFKSSRHLVTKINL